VEALAHADHPEHVVLAFRERPSAAPEGPCAATLERHRGSGLGPRHLSLDEAAALADALAGNAAVTRRYAPTSRDPPGRPPSPPPAPAAAPWMSVPGTSVTRGALSQGRRSPTLLRLPESGHVASAERGLRRRPSSGRLRPVPAQL
jgi:hypothetical protein